MLHKSYKEYLWSLQDHLLLELQELAGACKIIPHRNLTRTCSTCAIRSQDLARILQEFLCHSCMIWQDIASREDCRLSTYTVVAKVITHFLIAFAWAWVWGGVGSMCDDTGYINMQCATLSMCRNYYANPGKNAGSLTHTYTYTFPRSYILTYSLLGWWTRVHGAAETEEKLKSPAPPSTNYTPPRPHRGRVWGKRAVREARINDTELDINAIVKTVQLTRGSQSFAFWLRFQKISFWLYALNHLSRHSALEDKIFVYLT